MPLFRNRVYLISTTLFGIVLPLINFYSKDFFDKSRPIGEYGVENVHTVPWLVNLYHDSFPSGHTMGAFGFFLILNHFMPANKWYISLPFFLLACACAYSRIYLGQHFFSDVVAGSLIGGTPIYATKTGTAYPRGTQDVFVTALAPADFNETVNTSALPYYAKQRIKDFDRGFDLHVQANQLPTVLKPKALVKVKSTT